mmetsp:Transcript_87070/g.198731  ORF Transcript_87070/g.198731 Transcript_87070/m.198731 type:complete len:116 (-) Transcript_87070:370-717(-)
MMRQFSCTLTARFFNWLRACGETVSPRPLHTWETTATAMDSRTLAWLICRFNRSLQLSSSKDNWACDAAEPQYSLQKKTHMRSTHLEAIRNIPQAVLRRGQLLNQPPQSAGIILH